MKLILVEQKETGKGLPSNQAKASSTVSKCCSNKMQPLVKVLDADIRELIVIKKQ